MVVHLQSTLRLAAAGRTNIDLQPPPPPPHSPTPPSGAELLKRVLGGGGSAGCALCVPRCSSHGPFYPRPRVQRTIKPSTNTVRAEVDHWTRHSFNTGGPVVVQ